MPIKNIKRRKENWENKNNIWRKITKKTEEKVEKERKMENKT